MRLLLVSTLAAAPKAPSDDLWPVAVSASGQKVLLAALDSFGQHGNDLVELDVTSGARSRYGGTLPGAWAHCGQECAGVLATWRAGAWAIPDPGTGWTVHAAAAGPAAGAPFASCGPHSGTWAPCEARWPGGRVELERVASGFEVRVEHARGHAPGRGARCPVDGRRARRPHQRRPLRRHRRGPPPPVPHGRRAPAAPRVRPAPALIYESSMHVIVRGLTAHTRRLHRRAARSDDSLIRRRTARVTGWA